MGFYAFHIFDVMTVNGKMAITFHSMEHDNGADKNFFDRSIKTLYGRLDTMVQNLIEKNEMTASKIKLQSFYFFIINVG